MTPRTRVAAALALAAFLGAAAATRSFHPSDTAGADRTANRAADAAPVSPDAAFQRLKDGNRRFAENRLQGHDLGPRRREELVGGQHPFAIVLTCADSRVAPEFVFDQGLGDLFVLRVAGNVADAFELGSIEYGVEHLHVPLVVVLGHERCGAVQAALDPKRLTGNLGELVALVEVGRHLPPGADGASAAVRNNVRHQTRLLTARSDVIKEHVEKKEVRIVSGVYQLGSGKVDWLKED